MAGLPVTFLLALPVSQVPLPNLYWHLVGFITLGLVAAMKERAPFVPEWGISWMAGAVLLVELSLLPLTGLWPSAPGGRWAQVFAAWTALPSLLVATVMLLSVLRELGELEELGELRK